MAYFTPTQGWIRDLWSTNAQNSQGNQMGVMAPQMSMPPLSAPSRPQPAPQMSEQRDESPISRGIAAGMGAGRQSLDMDAKQREQAMGLMMFHMFSGLSGKNPTIMGSLSDGLTAGMPHLQQERANIAKLNAMEQERQDMMAKEMQRQKEHAQQRSDLQSHRREMLSLKREKSGSGGGRSNNPYYGLPAEGKLMLQQHEIDQGFLPGSNRTVPLTPEQQEEYSDLNALRMQKNTTDSDTRKRAIFAENLVKAIDKTNVDDLTRYSGPQGRARLKLEEAKDLTGNPSEDYLKHKEALTAVQIEAKELRQALGESITPAMAEKLEHLTNPTGFFTSPKTAKRQIQATRSLIQGQMNTFKENLKRPSSKMGSKATSSGNAVSNFKSKYPQLANKPEEEILEYLESRGELNE